MVSPSATTRSRPSPASTSRFARARPSASWARVDPLTYAVDPIRRAVFAHLDISVAARRALDPGVTWFGWRVPTLVEAGVVALLGLAMLGIAVWEFSRAE